MELVQNSAEHYFITKLDELSGSDETWYCLYFSLSKMMAHKTVLSDLSTIETRMHEASEKRNQFVADIRYHFGEILKGYLYAFSDLDVLVLCPAGNEKHRFHIKEIFQQLSEKLPPGFSDISALSGNFAAHHKLADQKLLSAKLHDAYKCLADSNKVSSIAARRKRRKEPLVMVVEDDRFTAHYASTIISKEFDLIMCKSAEEAIESYIENVPDIVFMDIHLPGLSGHDAVEAIYAADPEAFIVMLSVDTVKENVVKASMNGARKFLKKPFTRDRLIDTVKSSPYVRALTRTHSTGHETMMT